MRAPFTRLYLHCVWATWDRLPLLTADVEGAVYSAILDKSRQLRCEPIAIGGTLDHVHLLVRLPTTICVADLIKEIKGASSHLITHRIATSDFFKWQGAYGAFTLGPDQVPAAKAYIERQKQHHAQNTVVAGWEQMGSGEEKPGD